MDVRMPGIGGLEATKKLVRLSPDTQVIAVSAYEDDPFPSRLLKAGASGFVSKGADISEIIQAIRIVRSGQRYLSPSVAQQLALKSFNNEHLESPFEALSERELQICMMIVNCHKVAHISETLHLSPKTVNSYRYRVFEKLDISSDVELTLLAIRHGMLEVGLQES
jgi:DNA-binding NarL/FixJ family response regulator